MYNSFVSIISVLQEDYQLRVLDVYLQELHTCLEKNFTDFEIILVNNHLSTDPGSILAALPASIREHIFLLNLSSKAVRNHAIIAGLDRANGDYNLIYEVELKDPEKWIPSLFEKTKEGFDIVYLRSSKRKSRHRFRWFTYIFYYILRRYSNLKVDEGAYDTRIISRRALNSLLRLRENLRYMKAIYSIVGYPTAYIELDQEFSEHYDPSFRNRFRTSLVAITSFTTFLRSLLLGVFLVSFLFLLGVIINALLVRFTGYDILGNPEEAVKGWTFLVMLISLFFAANFLILYIMSVYLSNIYEEIKQRPLYIIESIKRF